MPDNIPVIGPTRALPNLVRAFGFSAHGFELGPIGGRIVADLVTEGRTSLQIAAFAVDRSPAAPPAVRFTEKKGTSAVSDDIQRHHSNERLSRVVVHNGVVYVAGCTATDRSGDAQTHTADILKKIDGYLESVGTNKKRLLSVQIWLQDIERDFAGLNAAWAEWVPTDAMPTRATCETKLAAPDLRVEIIVTAALRAFSLEARRKLLNPLRPCAWRSIRHAQRSLPRLKATFADRPSPR